MELKTCNRGYADTKTGVRVGRSSWLVLQGEMQFRRRQSQGEYNELIKERIMKQLKWKIFVTANSEPAVAEAIHMWAT